MKSLRALLAVTLFLTLLWGPVLAVGWQPKMTHVKGKEYPFHFKLASEATFLTHEWQDGSLVKRHLPMASVLKSTVSRTDRTFLRPNSQLESVATNDRYIAKLVQEQGSTTYMLTIMNKKTKQETTRSLSLMLSSGTCNSVIVDDHLVLYFRDRDDVKTHFVTVPFAPEAKVKTATFPGIIAQLTTSDDNIFFLTTVMLDDELNHLIYHFDYRNGTFTKQREATERMEAKAARPASLYNRYMFVLQQNTLTVYDLRQQKVVVSTPVVDATLLNGVIEDGIIKVLTTTTKQNAITQLTMFPIGQPQKQTVYHFNYNNVYSAYFLTK